MSHPVRLSPVTFAVALALAACDFNAIPVVATESEAFDRLQATLKTHLWPAVRVAPVPGDNGQPKADGALAEVEARLALSPVDLVAQELDRRCTEAAENPDQPVDLGALLDSGAPALAGEDPATLRLAFDRMKLFNLFWTVDVVRFLESPETGPDAELIVGLPHYGSLKRLLFAIDAQWQQNPPVSESDLRRPEYLDAAHAVALELVGFLLDLKAAHAVDEVSAWAFAGKWLAVDFDRYINIADNGLPRFERIGLLSDLQVDQGDHFWSTWTVSDTPAREIADELARLGEDRRAVQQLWSQQFAEKSSDGLEGGLCAVRAELAPLVAAAAPESSRVKPKLSDRLHDRLKATLRLGQDSFDADVRAFASGE